LRPSVVHVVCLCLCDLQRSIHSSAKGEGGGRETPFFSFSFLRDGREIFDFLACVLEERKNFQDVDDRSRTPPFLFFPPQSSESDRRKVVVDHRIILMVRFGRVLMRLLLCARERKLRVEGRATSVDEEARFSPAICGAPETIPHEIGLFFFLFRLRRFMGLGGSV